MLEEKLIQVTTHNFCKNEVITHVKKIALSLDEGCAKYKLCWYFGRTNSDIFKRHIGVIKCTPRTCNGKIALGMIKLSKN